ncbi:MAG TPA: extracellular solute-binding protein [Gemmatimonadales bacterium]|nr:extracellular solute-binding protein [Gemmatimonadales bacterium]
MAAWAAGAGTLGRFAAGCTGRDAARTASGLERELRILAPRGAFDSELLDRFGADTGVRVSLEQYSARPGVTAPPADGGFDLIAFRGPAAGPLAAAGRIAAVDRSLIPRLDGLLPLFRQAGSELLAVTWSWDATGVAWRAAQLPDIPGASPTTWCVFFEPSLSGRMTMLDDPREVLGAMLLLRARSVNATDASLLQQARDDALACRPYLEGYRSRGAVPFMPDGIVVSQARSSDAARAMKSEPGISFAIPKEGGPLFAEQVGLAAAAPHPRAAHAFIDYILRPETSARLAAATGRYSPLAGGVSAGSAPALPLDRLEPVIDAGEASSLYDRYWTEIQSA